MSLNHRTSSNARKCPYCSGQRVLVGYNDFKSIYPHLAKEWNYEKNQKKPEDYTKHSNQKVWWKCKNGHEWESSISHRVLDKTNCPICSKFLKKSFREICVYYYVHKYFNDAISSFNEFGFELDIYIPFLKIGIEYDGSIYHKNIEKDLNKNIKCKNLGIKIYRIREYNCLAINDNISINYTLEDKSFKVLNDIIYVLLNNIFESYNIKKEINVNIDRDYSNIINCFHMQTTIKNNFANSDLDFKDEWNYEKNKKISPKSISPHSNIKVWWKCKLGHEWMSTINNRANGCKCPYCSSNKLLSGFNDFETKYPIIAKQWDYNKNTKKPNEVFSSTTKKYWFLCDKKHSFERALNSIVNDDKSSFCPYCNNRKALKGYNDITTYNNKVIDFWDYNENQKLPENYLVGSHTIVNWKCDKGHKWEREIRVQMKRMYCPICFKLENN